MGKAEARAAALEGGYQSKHQMKASGGCALVIKLCGWVSEVLLVVTSEAG
jgi:hypothetical protein